MLYQLSYTRVWGEKDSNLRRHPPADLQSAAIDRSAISPKRIWILNELGIIIRCEPPAEPPKGLEPPTN